MSKHFVYLVVIFFNSPTTHYFSFKHGLALQLFHHIIRLLLMTFQSQIPMSRLAPSPSDSVPEHMKAIQYFQQQSLFSGRSWVPSIPSFSVQHIQTTGLLYVYIHCNAPPSPSFQLIFIQKINTSGQHRKQEYLSAMCLVDFSHYKIN